MTNDLTMTITLDCTPEQAFSAVNDVRGWWSGVIDGPTDHLGAEFTYTYQHLHRSTQRITEFVPNSRVAWHVTDGYLDFVTDKTEWTDTHITFDIAPAADGTRITFTHVGLAPEVECYEQCSPAWQYYITTSLHDLIVHGVGRPNKAESGVEAERFAS
jgi:hypothetical protein